MEVGRKRGRSDDSLLSRTQALLRKYGLQARRRLGQNFLVDQSVLDSILGAAGLTSKSCVVEVGPGLGVLTRELAARAGRVMAVELDDSLAALLRAELLDFSNLSVMNANILDSDIPGIVRSMFPCQEYNVVANIPYYITSPVLRHFLESSIQPRLMVIMVQKEVAEQIAATPGKMSVMAISVQVYGKPEIMRIVPSASFFPAPEVDSAILKVTPYDKPLVPESDNADFFKLVRAGFRGARKQLTNSMSNGLQITKEEADSLLISVGIDPRRRAETLSIDEWKALLAARKGTQA